MPCDMDATRDKTETYWRELESVVKPESRNAIFAREYLNGLLRDEIACAQERAAKQEGVWPQERAEVLVLLIGHSLEPLLQTICAYQPQEVVLVLNQKYDKKSGEQFAQERVLPWLDALKGLNPPLLQSQFKTREPVWPRPPQGSQPGDIFRLLLQALRDDVKAVRNIIIDITGGKKSMVAGAYFFAAYTNAKISYVDFEEYDERKRRPYGFSCQIGLLPNPYEIYGLRDWEQVKNLYERFFFDEALNQLRGIIKDMSLEYFQPEQIGGVRRLHEIMRVYQAWSLGDYTQSKALSEQVRKLSQNFRPLASVEALYPIWPQNIETEQKLRGDDWSFYANHELILQYALDESAKVDRIVKLKEDYRSGLLRAAGLNEVLLKARLALLWKRGLLTLFDGTRQLSDSDGKKAIANGAKAIKAYFAEDILQGGNEVEIQEKYGNKIAIKAKEALPYMSQLPEGLALLTRIRELRNKVIHFVIPISKQIAYEAVEVMQKNVQDFEQVWVKSLSPNHNIKPDVLPDWEELCAWCGIDFLPYQKQQEKQL